MFRAPRSEFTLLVAAFSGKIFGMHPRTGERIWRYDIGGLPIVRTLVLDERVYALGGALVCLEYMTGQVIWRTELSGTFTGGTLVVGSGIVAVADAGEVGAYDAESGRQLWTEGFRGEGAGGVSLALPGCSAQIDRRD
jgi:outer membrane protein assembly factor BamB